MDYSMIIFNYVIWAISFIFVYVVTKQSSKSLRYISLFIYLATVGLYTFLVIAEVINPSEDANIGLGGAILLMEFVSIAGIIIAAIIYLVRRLKQH